MRGLTLDTKYSIDNAPSHPLAGCPVVALDVEVRAGELVELGLAGPQGVRRYRGEAGIRRALERLQERAPLVVGHNLKGWDLPALERQFADLGPWRFPLVDTLEWQARLSPWRGNLALAAAHRADADAGLALDLFARQLGVLARAGLLNHMVGPADSGRMAAEAGLSGLMGLAGSAARAGLEEFRAELDQLDLQNLDTERLSGLPDPETSLEPDGVHPWLVRIEQRIRQWDESNGGKLGRDPESNFSSGTAHALLLVLPPFLLKAFAARGQRVILGNSGDLCLRESRLAWRNWSTGHGLSLQGLHPLTRPVQAEKARCMGCPDAGCPAHPERLDHWGVSWQDLDDSGVQRFLEQHPPAKVIHLGGDVATGWSWREHGRFRDGQLAGAGLLTASFSLGTGPRSRLRITAEKAQALLGCADTPFGRISTTAVTIELDSGTIPGEPPGSNGDLAPDSIREIPQIHRLNTAHDLRRSWFLERIGPGEVALASVLTDPLELVSALGTRASEGISGLLDHKQGQPPRVFFPMAESAGLKPENPATMPLAAGSPLRAEYWAGVLPRLLPLLGANPVLLVLRLPEEVESIRRVLAELCSPLYMVEDPELGSLVRRLRRMPGALAVIAAAQLDELPALDPRGVTLVLECIDSDGIPVIHAPGNAYLEETEQDSLDLKGMEEEVSDLDAGSGSTGDGAIPTGWRRRGTELWLGRLGHQLLDYTAAGGGETWLLDARLVSAPPTGITVVRRPLALKPASALLIECLARNSQRTCLDHGLPLPTGRPFWNAPSWRVGGRTRAPDTSAPSSLSIWSGCCAASRTRSFRCPLVEESPWCSSARLC